MKKMKKVLASLAIAGMLATMAPFNAFAAVPELGTRLAGVTAYDTAQQIAQQYASADAVVLAAGMTRNSVDALAAGPLAAKVGGPILLTSGSETLTAQAKAELQRLMPKKVYVTSGTAVIKPAVLDQVKAITGADSVVALGGIDAYATSLNIAKQMVTLGAAPTGVVVAGGWASPADALSAASIASAKGMPILAVAKAGLNADQLAFVNSLTGVTNSYIVGGTAVVAGTVEATLPGTVARLAGNTQYDTNLKVLQNFTDLDYDKVFVANGKTFVDALAGAPFAAKFGAPIVLADQVVNSALAAFVQSKMSATSTVIALGGTAAVPQSVVDGVKNPAVPATQLSVTSVSSLNISDIAVTFNKALDVDAAEDASNYEVQDEDGKDVNGVDFARLSADGKTVLLTMGDGTSPIALDNNEEYTLVIANDLSDSEVPELAKELEKTFMVNDTSLPTVTNVEAIGDQLVAITFNKPVDLNSTKANSFSIQSDDEGTFTVGSLTDGGAPGAFAAGYRTRTYSRAYVALGNKLSIGSTYYIKVIGGGIGEVRDADGLKLSTVTKSFEVKSYATVAQPISVVVKSRTGVRVKFDQPIRYDGSSPKAVWSLGNDKNNVSNSLVLADQIDDYTLDFSYDADEASALPVAKGVTIAIEDVTDRFGNDVPSKSFTVDVPASSATTVKVDPDNDPTIDFGSDTTTVWVKYSRAVDEDLAEDEDNYVFTESDGDVADTEMKSATLQADDKTVKIVYDEELAAGDYKLKISGIEDGFGDPVATTTLKVVLEDDVAGSLQDADTIFRAWDAGADTVIVIQYPEKMDTTTARSILDLDNYKYSTAASASYVSFDEDDTDIEIIEGLDNTVRITAEGFDFSGGAETIDHLKVLAVNDDQGNLFETFDTASAGAASVNLGPATRYSIAGKSLKIIDDSTLELTIGRALTAADESDFILQYTDGVTPKNTTNGSAGNDISSVTFENDGLDESVITIKTSLDLSDSDISDVSIKTYNNSSTSMTSDDTVDMFEAELTSGVVSALAASGIAAEISNVSVVGTKLLRLTFDEEMAFVSASDFKVMIGTEEYDTTQTGTAVTALDGAKVWDLALDDAISITSTPTISLAVDADDVQTEDVNGNKLVVDGDIVALNLRIASVKFDAGDNTALESDESIVIKFVNSIDPESIDAGWNGDESAVVAGLGLTAVTFTDGANDTIVIDNVGTFAYTGTAVVTTAFTLAGATYELNSANDELTVTLVGLAAEAAKITEGLPAVATFTAEPTLMDEDGDAYINVGYVPMTATLLAATTMVGAGQGVADDTFNITNNYATTADVADVDMDAATAGVQASVTLNGLTYTATELADVVTVTVTGAATATAPLTTLVIKVKDASVSTSVGNLLTLHIPAVTAADAAATVNVTID